MKPWVLLMVLFACITLNASDKKAFDVPVHKIEQTSKAKSTDAPKGPLLGSLMCDASGSIYLRYFPVGTQGSSFQGGLAKITSTGHFTQLAAPHIPDVAGSPEVFRYAIANDGKLYEVVHSIERLEGRPPKSKTHLVVISEDGTLASSHELEAQVFPNLFVPYNDGNVLIGGTLFKTSDQGDTTKESFLGVFASDGSLKRRLVRPKATLTPEEKERGSVDPAIHGGAATLGPDDNAYVLLAGSPLRVQVISPSATVLHNFTLETPLKSAVASRIFVARGRLLVPQYGKYENGKPGNLWIVYSSQDGKPISAYEPPDRDGMPACWEDGKRLNFLIADPSTGLFGISSADVE